MRVSTKDLRAALGAVGSAVSSRPGIPALTGVRIVAGAGSLELTTTDLEASAVAEVGAEAETAGETWSALVPFRMLKDAARSFKGETFSLRPDGAGALVVNGAGSLRLLVLEDFPSLETPAELIGSFDAADLRRLIEAVAPACSTDEARPVLTGALLELDGVCLKLTATDSYRMHHGELGSGACAEGKAIVPGRVLRAVSKLVGAKGSGRVLVRAPELTIDKSGALQGSALSFEVALEGKRAVLVVSRVIEGEYPNYAQLVPDPRRAGDDGGTLRFEPAALLEAIGNAAPYCLGTSPARLELNDAGLRISASSPDLGAYAAEVDGCDYVGDPMSVAFNPTYLAGCVAALADASETVLELRDGLKPGVVRATGDDLERIALVMPVRLPAVAEVPTPAKVEPAPEVDDAPAEDETDPGVAEHETDPEPIGAEDEAREAEVSSELEADEHDGAGHVVDLPPAPVFEPAPVVEHVAAVAVGPIPEPTTTDWAELVNVGEVGSGRSRLVVRVIGGPDGTPWVDARRFVTSARYDGPTRKGWAIPAAIVADVIELLENARAAAELEGA